MAGLENCLDLGFVLGGQPVPGVVKNSRNYAAVFFPMRLRGGILN